FVVAVCILSFLLSIIRRHTMSKRDWSSDVCSSDLGNHSGGHGAAGYLIHIERMCQTWKRFRFLINRCSLPKPSIRWTSGLTVSRADARREGTVVCLLGNWAPSYGIACMVERLAALK